MFDTDEKKQTGQTPPGDAWQEVGQQFRVLGQTLAAALRASWHAPENRTRVQSMQADLARMVRDVDAAITDAAASPQARQARAEAQRTVESLRQAGEETIQEVRPRLLTALQDLNAELERWVKRMESAGRKAGPEDGPAGPDAPAAPGEEQT